MYPLGGGGIGQFVAAAAQLLSRIADVTIITTSDLEQDYQRLRTEGDRRLPGQGVQFAFVPEPTVEEAGGWYNAAHCYGARVYERLKQLYPEGGPELIEFPDFRSESFVTLQAAEALDPFLAETRVCVRIHTSGEICAVLDGYYPRDLSSQALYEMERFSLAHADRLLWPGGDVLGTYQRFYGIDALAPPMRIRHPYAGPVAVPGSDAGFRVNRQLRILYGGRLERRKGVQQLIQAATSLYRDDFRLTLIGGDTNTAPLGGSMRQQLELAIAEDPRIELREPLDRQMLAAAISEHDAVVIPSLWECWPYAALEALRLNRPILAAPVGGLVEIVQPGASGWLASDTSAVSLVEALEPLLDRRDELERMVRSEAPAARAQALGDEREILDAYQALSRTQPRRSGEQRRFRSRPPLVSAIVPYYRASRYVSDAIDSLLAQTYPRLEIMLVNDGSFEEQDWIVAEIAARLPVTVVTQMNQGLGAARNFGVLQSRGRYVFPLDCDNIAEPEFIARCVEILERRRDVAYVTTWSRYIDDGGVPLSGPAIGYQPLGNRAALVARHNVAGDAAAVIRRRIFDSGFRYSEELTSLEDWALYRELHRAGHFGVVIPERLLRYRVRADSMTAEFALPKLERLEGEIDALICENSVQWKSSSA